MQHTIPDGILMASVAVAQRIGNNHNTGVATIIEKAWSVPRALWARSGRTAAQWLDFRDILGADCDLADVVDLAIDFPPLVGLAQLRINVGHTAADIDEQIAGLLTIAAEWNSSATDDRADEVEAAARTLWLTTGRTAAEWAELKAAGLHTYFGRGDHIDEVPHTRHTIASIPHAVGS